MTNLNELKIVNADYDLKEGFFFLEFNNGKSLQCCLKEYHDGVKDLYYFNAQIEIRNSGYNEGSCADCNEWAVVDGEWEHIEEFLIDVARTKGIEIVA